MVDYCSEIMPGEPKVRGEDCRLGVAFASSGGTIGVYLSLIHI